MTGVIVRTIDTGGAGPISGLLEADRMIRTQGRDLVAIVAGMAMVHENYVYRMHMMSPYYLL